MQVAATEEGRDWAFQTYEAYAPAYDVFTAHYDNDGWLADLIAELRKHGLRGKRLLDVGCGTGKSFMFVLRQGWEVTACDISPAMLARAREKAGEGADLQVADMRELPRFGEFDAVWCLDDAVNYLLGEAELLSALRGMRENLSSSGLLAFDVNALHAYRTFFAETDVIERDGYRLTWRGQAAADVEPGSVCESTLEVASLDRPAEEETARTHRHRQRHFTEAEVLAALERAGLECLAVYGHGYDGIFKQPLDESVHTKAIYIARLARA